MAPGASAISGTISPQFATVTIDDIFVIVRPNGHFYQAVPPGQHWVNASYNGYSSFNKSYMVAPGQNLSVPIVLVGSDGWINGTMDPPGGQLSVNGKAVTVNYRGVFNDSVAPSTYDLIASLPGYDSIEELVIVPAGGTVFANFSLNQTPAAPLLTNTQLVLIIGGSGAGVLAVAAFLFIRKDTRPKRPKNKAKWAPEGT
ncbi:MAG: hypothetical protein ACHQ2Y_01720 [Candidatus Lutacidiplasmatales archaeon]